MSLQKLAFTTLTAAVFTSVSFAQSTYTIGGPAGPLTPSSGALAWDGVGMAGYRAAVTDDAYFGPGGLAPTTIQTRSLDTVNDWTLKQLDAFVCSSWHDSEMTTQQRDDIIEFFLDGGDLILISDDHNHDAVAEALGVKVLPGFNETTGLTTDPLGRGSFGKVANFQVPLSSPGYVDDTRVRSKNGQLGAVTPFQLAAAAWWNKGAFGPNTGALVILCDPDLMAFANYNGLGDRARYALNMTAFLSNRMRVEVIGGPSSNVQISSGTRAWEDGSETDDIKAALQRSDYFGADSHRMDIRFHYFDTIGYGNLGLCNTFIAPFWKDQDMSPAVRSAIRTAAADGMNLIVWAETPDSVGLLTDLGIGTTTSTSTYATIDRPISNGVFGSVTGLYRTDDDLVMDVNDVLNRGGFVTATDSNIRSVAAIWRKWDIPGHAGNLLAVTDSSWILDSDVDYDNLDDKARFALNAFHHVMTDRKIRVGGPGANLNGNVDGWANGAWDGFRNALMDRNLFGPQGVSEISFEPIDVYSWDAVTLATLDIMVPGKWWNWDLGAVRRSEVSAFVHRGGRLLLTPDDTASDDLCGTFALTATQDIAKATGGGAPSYIGPFGSPQGVGQAGSTMHFPANQFEDRGGRIVGTNISGDVCVGLLPTSAVGPRSGAILAIGDPHMIINGSFIAMDERAVFGLNSIDYLAKAVFESPVLNYGMGHPGAGGLIPGLRLEGSFTDNTRAGLRITNMVGGARVLLLFGTSGRISYPYRDFTILVNFPWTLMTWTVPGIPGKPGDSQMFLQGSVPPGLNQLPQGLNVQALIYDAQASAGFAATDAVEMAFR